MFLIKPHSGYDHNKKVFETLEAATSEAEERASRDTNRDEQDTYYVCEVKAVVRAEVPRTPVKTAVINNSIELQKALEEIKEDEQV